MVVEALTQENYADKKSGLILCSQRAGRQTKTVWVSLLHLRDDVYFHMEKNDGRRCSIFLCDISGRHSIANRISTWIDFAGTEKVDDLTVHVPMNDFNITWEDDLQFVGIYCKSYTEANKDNPDLYMKGCVGNRTIQDCIVDDKR